MILSRVIIIPPFVDTELIHPYGFHSYTFGPLDFIFLLLIFSTFFVLVALCFAALTAFSPSLMILSC